MLKTNKFDILKYLKTEKDMEEYLNVVLEEQDYTYLPVALADIAQAKKAMTSAVEAPGVSPTPLYQSLIEEERPAFETVAKAAHALGYRITLVPLAGSS